MKNTGEIVPSEARNVIRRLEEAGYEAWCVGGCVRDSLLGREPHDWDVATSALPEEVMDLFGKRCIPRGLKHGTVFIRSGRDGVEVTSYRCDGEYEDHRRPASVTFTRSLDEDLWRRDLTVNAMAMSLEGELRDPFDGRGDLKRKLLRCVGEPDRRFQEDALRMMRVLRFASTLGFAIDPEAAAAVHRNRELLNEIAIERIQTEMLGLLAGRNAAAVLREFSDVVGVFWPELLECVGFEQKNVHHCYDVWEHTLHALDEAEILAAKNAHRWKPSKKRRSRGGGQAGQTPPGKKKTPEKDPKTETAVLCCAALLHDIGKPRTFVQDEQGVGHFPGHAATGTAMADEMLRRLRCPRIFRERVVRLVEWHDRGIPQTERAIRRTLGRLGEDDLRMLLLLKRADNLAQSPDYQGRQAELDRAEQALDDLLARNACLTLRDLAVNGRDIGSMGLTGRDVGEVLEILLDRVIDMEVPNERKALMKAAKPLARERRKRAAAQKAAQTAAQPNP